MMKLILVGVFLSAYIPAMLAAQSGSTSASTQKPARKPAPQVVTLVGCIEGTGGAGDPFRLSDGKDGIVYRLTGTNMRAYKGKRVQLAGGSDTRRLKIVGGLMPSATVAGQAGAMDPSRAAVASDPLSTAGKSDQ